jgi:hypothetical protein
MGTTDPRYAETRKLAHLQQQTIPASSCKRSQSDKVFNFNHQNLEQTKREHVFFLIQQTSNMIDKSLTLKMKAN